MDKGANRMTVKRYWLELDEYVACDCDMSEGQEGDWVTWEDYTELMDRFNEQARAIMLLAEQLKNAESQLQPED